MTRPAGLDVRAFVDFPIVEPAGTAAPELDLSRHEPVAGPERRTGDDLALVPFSEIGDTRFELRAADEPIALTRGPRADLAVAWARRKIRVRLEVADELRVALDAHLAIGEGPVNAERRVPGGGEVAGFAALEV